MSASQDEWPDKHAGEFPTAGSKTSGNEVILTSSSQSITKHYNWPSQIKTKPEDVEPPVAKGQHTNDGLARGAKQDITLTKATRNESTEMGSKEDDSIENLGTLV